MGKSLDIQKNRYGLRVFCAKCDKLYYWNTIGNCKHDSDSQKYKSVVYHGSGTKSTRFDTNSYDDALTLAIHFKKDVKNGVLDNVGKREDRVEPHTISVVDGANMFLSFKHGINVPIHLREELSCDYLKSIKHYVGQFINILRKNKVDPTRLAMVDVDERHVGLWAEMVRSKYSEGSWNAPLRIMRLWFNHMITRYKMNIYNPFMDVKLVKVENNVEAITRLEFVELCDAIRNASPYQYFEGNSKIRKCHYKPYLETAFRLALFSGLRREELLTLTWDDVKKVNDTGEHIIVTENLKVERITKEKYNKKYVPVHADLKELLLELGWESNKGSSNYIICPNRTASVKTMMKYLTKSFTHYYKSAFSDRPTKTFGVLRKTYLTYMGMELGEEVVKFSSHSGKEVLEDHYFDMRLVTQGLQVRIFG